ncbi:MAG: TatD family hydrolase [Cellvibrionaceae bacterium]|nr:TatD family hydrolase [Cellvibrionaceae bacterium]
MLPVSNFLIDSHCHFDFSEFDNDREALWSQCRQANIRRLIIPGVTPGDTSKALALCGELPGVYCAAGLHPWWIPSDAGGDRALLAQLSGILSNNKCVAVGESGLDSLIELPMKRQVTWFERHLSLAQQYKLPVIIHNRKAHSALLRSVDELPPPCGGVVHAFSGSFELGKQMFNRGLLLGIGGGITYPRANKTRAAIASLPLDALLLETDAPDMPLWGKQGERNSPVNLPEIAACLAELKNLTTEQIIEHTTRNALRLFRL